MRLSVNQQKNRRTSLCCKQSFRRTARVKYLDSEHVLHQVSYLSTSELYLDRPKSLSEPPGPGSKPWKTFKTKYTGMTKQNRPLGPGLGESLTHSSITPDIQL
ncbi:uncharacterized protein YALI1_D30241g [Yarrowia lipolytica]|uniref:Uncharacterized protein n=1 Tax=Yarrowia lipolytica TaxID=4952 RepID=A0A1D8NFV3_YARLL|nr:hypothetical protein YALI1_D30241g [Yarrowia lipolytica]